MADFSKQYCELYDPEMSWDFDIIEEYNKLDTGYSVGMVCEGFGFLAIAKGHNNEILVAFNDSDDDDYIHWIEYDEFLEKFKNRGSQN